MVNKFPIKTAILGGVFMVACAMSAEATLVLSLDDGAGHTATVLDNGAGDLHNTTTGSILDFGSLGTWSFTITALSKPALGTATKAQMDLNVTASTSSKTGGTLKISIVDTGFGPLLGNKGFVTIGASGIWSGSGKVGTVTDYGQINGSSVVKDGPFSTATWSGNSTGNATGLGSLFSMGESVTITDTAKGGVIGDDFEEEVVLVPETSTWIAGTLLLLPFGARRFRNAFKHTA